jgi:hypothetical protein
MENCLSLIEKNSFMTKSPIAKETLNRILEETISTRIEKKGFKWDKNSLWFTDNKNSIRQVIKYVKLKGEAGTFFWGVCLDFVPTISDNKVIYHRSEKNVTLHLFEWTDEYANAFFGGQLGGVTTHYGENEARQSIARLFDNYENKIFGWFENANTIDNLIRIATQQIQAEKSYTMHSPDPKFILAFLLAKAGQLDKGILTYEQLSWYKGNEELKVKIRQELINSST